MLSDAFFCGCRFGLTNYGYRFRIMYVTHCKITMIIMGNKKGTEQVGVEVTPTHISIPQMFAVGLL